MSFLPKEVQERLREKDQHIHRLEEEVKALKERSRQSTSRSPRVLVPWGLFVLATAVAIWLWIGGPSSPERDIPEFLNANGEWSSVTHLPDSGIVFTVQIGAFEGFSLQSPNGRIEDVYQKENDGMKKVMLGRFTNLTHAQGFQKQMVELGLRNAYIVAYDNGQPIGLIEANQRTNETSKPK